MQDPQVDRPSADEGFPVQMTILFIYLSKTTHKTTHSTSGARDQIVQALPAFQHGEEPGYEVKLHHARSDMAPFSAAGLELCNT